jgi:hypothetical protein
MTESILLWAKMVYSFCRWKGLQKDVVREVQVTSTKVLALLVQKYWLTSTKTQASCSEVKIKGNSSESIGLFSFRLSPSLPLSSAGVA